MDSLITASPHHGGRLQEAAQRYGIPERDWLDLSTGINPEPWPVPMLDPEVWQRLPESHQALETAAQRAYQTRLPLLAVPGSQWAIQTLPQLFRARRVWYPGCGYQEHPFWWAQHGHQLIAYEHLPSPAQLSKYDAVLVVNPNNPTGEHLAAEHLQTLAKNLEELKGLLIVDEAFMDLTPEQSLLNHSLEPSTIVLRSVGKFYGLAGLRLGFVHCSAEIRQRLQYQLGPWSISHPAIVVGEQALTDQRWHAAARDRILCLSQQQRQILQNRFKPPQIKGCGLFNSLELSASASTQLFEHCAEQGILVRHFPDCGLIRFGLAAEPGLERLSHCLAQFKPAKTVS